MPAVACFRPHHGANWSGNNRATSMKFFGGKLSLANARPVLVRELRAESRRPISHWLRVLASAVVVTVFVAFVTGTQVSAARLGAELFGVLERTLLLAMWIIVPLMTADCISR